MKFVWPWVAVIANIGTIQAKGKLVGPDAYDIKEAFGQYRPEHVKCFWDHRGSMAVATLKFGSGMQSFDDCNALEKDFLEARHGKTSLSRNRALKTVSVGLYGWMADKVDHAESGQVGEFLRAKFDIHSMAEVQADAVRQGEALRQQIMRASKPLKTPLALTEKSSASMEAECKRYMKAKVESFTGGGSARTSMEGVEPWSLSPKADLEDVRQFELEALDLRQRVRRMDDELRGWEEWHELKRKRR